MQLQSCCTITKLLPLLFLLLFLFPSMPGSLHLSKSQEPFRFPRIGWEKSVLKSFRALTAIFVPLCITFTFPFIITSSCEDHPSAFTTLCSTGLKTAPRISNTFSLGLSHCTWWSSLSLPSTSIDSLALSGALVLQGCVCLIAPYHCVLLVVLSGVGVALFLIAGEWW